MGNFKVFLGDNTNHAEYIGQILADNNVPPSQTGNSGKFLTTNGTNQSWIDLPIDATTVTRNSGTSNLQVSSVLNQNMASGAIASCFDWIGTYQEYLDQDVATNHPDWICYIVDDFTASDSVYSKGEADAKFIAKNVTLTSVQVYASEAAALAASQSDPTKLCLYPAV